MVGDESNNAILEFLMKDKKDESEKRAREEERRLAEREEDAKRMEKFQNEIIKIMRTEVKTEIQTAVEPLKERQEKSEKEAEETNSKVDVMMDKIEELKKQIEKIGETKNSKSGGGGVETESIPKGWRTSPISESKISESKGMEEKSVILLRNARRVVGFKPIDKAHVKHCMRRVEQESENIEKEDAWERAKEKAVHDFLKYEMKMKEDDIKQVTSVMIYPPAKDEWNVLYVEYESIEMVNFIMSFAQFLRKGEKENRPSVEKYVPMELFKRYSAVEKIAYEIRQKSNFQTSTNVSFGEKDIILKSRPKEIQPGGRKTPWSQIEPIKLPEDIPTFEMNLVRRVPQSPRSPGQAPGRPPHTPEQNEKRKTRGSPYSSSPSSPTPKQQKRVTCPNQPAGRTILDSPSLTTSNRFQCLEGSQI